MYHSRGFGIEKREVLSEFNVELKFCYNFREGNNFLSLIITN